MPQYTLSDAQIQAGARPGESWEDARRRLEAKQRVRVADCTECGRQRWHQAGTPPTGPFCDDCEKPVLEELDCFKQDPSAVYGPVLIEPTTDVQVYTALLEACVQAEASKHRRLAHMLRAWVDASPFSGCPACSGHAPLYNNEPCSVCHGRGFVPDDQGGIHGQALTARGKGV